MRLKIFSNYSPNFDPIKRHKNQIKFLIFHYTGMKKESDAIKKLTNSKSDVSCHHFIKNSGETFVMVPDLYIAWHAGISKFQGRENCNEFSIGIELEGTDNLDYTKNQYESLVEATKEIMKVYPAISKENIVGHSDIAPDRKTDPGDSFNWNLYLHNLF